MKIPVAAPQTAAVVSTPVLFPDGGNPGGTGYSATTGCHDITAYPSKDIAAGACMGDGILLDIADREHPVVTEQVRDTTNFAFWHSATFNNSGRKVVFTDELGGGAGATCNPKSGRTAARTASTTSTAASWSSGATTRSRVQANTENCVAHNGSLIPVNGKDIMVQAWYQGGISVWEFTNSSKPSEIAWFDRGPLAATGLLGGSWSAYWYNGHVYANDIQKGLDVIEVATQAVKQAQKVRFDVFNAQSQPSYNG